MIKISDELNKSVQEFLQQDSNAKKIAEIEQQLDKKRIEIFQLEADLSLATKMRPEVILEYRKSILWCLEVDAKSDYYFLKKKEGLVKCIEYKHKIKLTPKQNNSFGATLSFMFKEKAVGRTDLLDVFFYGVPSLFERDKDGLLTVLKSKYVKQLPYLRQITI